MRLTATVTSCQIFVKDPICQQVSVNALNTVNEVLGKLVSISITDPAPEIRLAGLNCLIKAGNFDPQLSQANNVRLLFIALNDEVFGVRKVAIQILGRLSCINPAYIVPSLRKTLIQLLSKLEYSTTSRKRRKAPFCCLYLLATRRN